MTMNQGNNNHYLPRHIIIQKKGPSLSLGGLSLSIFHVQVSNSLFIQKIQDGQLLIARQILSFNIFKEKRRPLGGDWAKTNHQMPPFTWHIILGLNARNISLKRPFLLKI